MIHIVDYGAGNLFSVKNALDYLQIENKITADPADLKDADGIILPGVGAFRDAMTMLNKSGFTEAIKEQAAAGKPLLGICLGMQMLFEKGYEFGESEGLGLIPGCVQLIDGGGLKIPHMGWNDLTVLHDCALSSDVTDGDYVYFVHSYYLEAEEDGVWYYPALLAMSFNLDSGDEFSMEFANATRLDDWGYTYADLIASASSTSRQVSANWQNLTSYTKDRDEIASIIQDPLDATRRAAYANMTNQEFVRVELPEIKLTESVDKNVLAQVDQQYILVKQNWNNGGEKDYLKTQVLLLD